MQTIHSFDNAPNNQKIKQICQQSPIIPVITLHDAKDAIPLAKALINGGLSVLEVTLRTPQALAAIERLKTIEHITVAAGTVKNANDCLNAVNAGADFIVSPGTTFEIIQATNEYNIPLLGGIATVSEAMTLSSHGLTFCKLFPAAAIGGIQLLKSLQSPLPELTFCPTGGINQQNYLDYLALGNVISIGSSWIASQHYIQQGNWQAIEDETRQALKRIEQSTIR